MKGPSRYSDMEFRQKSQSDLIPRVFIDARRFGAFSVDCHSNGLFARQTVSLIFSILTLCRSYPNGARWVETFLCAVGYPDDTEAISSLVIRPFELLASFPLCLSGPLCFAFFWLTLLTSLSMGPFSFTLTLLVTGLTPNPLPKPSRHIRLSLPRKEPTHVPGPQKMRRTKRSFGDVARTLPQPEKGEKM